MDVSRGLIEWLREYGYDAIHLREQDLKRLPDSQIFAKATAENRIILTCDLDFPEIVALSGASSVSVVVFRLSNTRTANLITRLARVLEDSAQDHLEEGAIISVEDSRHRVRLLPIGRER